MLVSKFKETEIHIGDTVKVRNNIIEGGKTRVQTYEGMIIAMRGRGENRTIVVRRIGPGGIGVERIWPLNSPNIVEIIVVKNPKHIRRSKLYFLRSLTGKSAVRI